MGFLDGLWEETLAGPAPEKGVSRLRKYKSLSAVRSPIADTRYHEDVDQTVGVSRSITIIRPKNLSVEPPPPPGGSAASSPSTTPSGPTSPFSPGETGKDPDGKRFSKRKPKPTQLAEPTSPTVYDWIMISALDL